MKIPCIIGQTKTLKKGMKITLAVEDDNVQEVLENIHRFHKRDLIVSFEVDAAKEEEKLDQISNEQRKKVYALFRDVAEATGNNKDHIKEEMKNRFIADTDYSKEKMSLANCSKDEASNFIEYIINFCFEYGIQIQDRPSEYFDNIEKAMYLCIDNEICSVCGAEAEVHHVDTIGMGHDRTQVDDSDKRKIALCREHHTEAHNIGWETFKEKYHVKGV